MTLRVATTNNRTLVRAKTIDVHPQDYLREIGDVFTVFDSSAQDSGNISYGVRIGDERYFVKTAGAPHTSTPARHEARIAALRNAVRLYRSCPHPTLATLRNVIESNLGPLLVYDWANGDLLGQDWRTAGSTLARFRDLPLDTAIGVLDQIYAAHHALAQAGWIAVDFYLNSLLFDSQTNRVTLIDPDLYSLGPFTNTMGRMYGSTSLMAPEEFELGGRIDQDTNVFGMGRLALMTIGDGSLESTAFRGDDQVYEVVRRACTPHRTHRFRSFADFYHAWSNAIPPCG